MYMGMPYQRIRYSAPFDVMHVMGIAAWRELPTLPVQIGDDAGGVMQSPLSVG